MTSFSDPFLDLHTLGIMLVLVAFGFATFVLFQSLVRPGIPGRRRWALGLLGLTSGILITMVREPPTIVLCNTLAVLGSALLVTAYRQFTAMTLPVERPFLFAVPVVAVILGLASFVVPHVGVRLALTSAYHGLAIIAVLVMCLRRLWPDTPFRLAYALNAFSVSLPILGGIPRLVQAIQQPERVAQFSPLFGNEQILMTVFVFVMVNSFAVLFLHDERQRRELIDLQHSLQALTETDPLTGLHNRRGLEVRYDVCLQTARQRPVSLVVIDIDHFKHLNDQFGHHIGDHCLQHLAGVLGSRIRTNDVLARYGGEEFVLLLSGANHEQAVTITRRVQEQLRAMAPNLPLFTISAGVTQLRPEETFQDAFARADQALYAVKHSGRNSVLSDHHLALQVALP